YMILLFVNSKLYLVDWNGRRRLLENTNRFSSCEVMLPKLSLTCWNSKRSSVGRTIVQSHEIRDPTVSEASEEAQAKPTQRVKSYILCKLIIQVSNSVYSLY